MNSSYLSSPGYSPSRDRDRLLVGPWLNVPNEREVSQRGADRHAVREALARRHQPQGSRSKAHRPLAWLRSRLAPVKPV